MAQKRRSPERPAAPESRRPSHGRAPSGGDRASRGRGASDTSKPAAPAGRDYRERRALAHVGGEARQAGDEALARDLAEALSDLSSRDADALTHGFHTYPAKMHPSIAARVVASLSTPQARVLDPFCGSGTVLVESRVAGRRATGVDLSPIALRLAAVKTELRAEEARHRFAAHVDEVAERSEERVRARVAVRAPLTREDASWYEPHLLKELAGLREEILAVKYGPDRRALEMVLSAIVVKFSKKRGDTSEREAPKRLRKGLVTEFFHRRGHELVARWADLAAVAPSDAPAPELIAGDARRLSRLVGRDARFDLVLTSPPYGGTYDYARHQALRWPWLGLDPRDLDRGEIGSRRRLGRQGHDEGERRRKGGRRPDDEGEGGTPPHGGSEAGSTQRGRKAPSGSARWDRELTEVLRSVAGVLAPQGRVVMLLGDAQLGSERVPADRQLERLAPKAGLRLRASASQPRPDWTGGSPREEHLILLEPDADDARPRFRPDSSG